MQKQLQFRVYESTKHYNHLIKNLSVIVIRSALNFHDLYVLCTMQSLFKGFAACCLLAPGIIITQNDILKIITYTPSTGKDKNQQHKSLIQYFNIFCGLWP